MPLDKLLAGGNVAKFWRQTIHHERHVSRVVCARVCAFGAKIESCDRLVADAHGPLDTLRGDYVTKLCVRHIFTRLREGKKFD